MSDLDADLYADLYGNDDGDVSGAAGPVKEEPKDIAPSTLTGEPPISVKTEATEPPEKSHTPKVEDASPVALTNAPAAAPISTSTQPAPSTPQHIATYTHDEKPQIVQPMQHIQTYEDSNGDEFREPVFPATSNGGNLQQMGAQQRSIRPSEMKDEGKMFVGGLNWETSDEALREYFTQFGKVDACTIMRDSAGRSRCFAFLTFEEAASVNAVMSREHFLDGKIIDPKRAIPRQEHQRATKLFIGGLAGSVTSESMREFFSQFGRVVDSTVMLDRETGRSKGFGFISFEDTDVTPFLGFGILEIDGKLIDVKLAQPRAQRDTFAEGGPPNPTSQTGGGGYNEMSGAPYGGGGNNNFNAGPRGGPMGRGGMGGPPFNLAAVGGGAPTGATGAGGGGQTPFDPAALAALYSRIASMSGGMGMMGGGMGMMGGMGGGMGPMMGGPGMGGMGGMGGSGGMGGPGMGGHGMGGGMGRGMGGGGPGMHGDPRMGRGGGMMAAGGAGGIGHHHTPTGPSGHGGIGPNVPRGPRAATGGAGPQRTGRGQHNYHPYAR